MSVPQNATAPKPTRPTEEDAPCPACDRDAMAEAWGQPDTYPDEAPEIGEADFFEPGEMRSDGYVVYEPDTTLTFPAWIAAQAARLRDSLRSEAGDWLAREIEDLAAWARRLNATTPAEYEARRELAEAWRDAAAGR